MATITTKEITSKHIWEDFVLNNEPESFLQSWNWGETQIGLGEQVIRMGFFTREKLIGGMQMIRQDAKRGPHYLIPGGPLIDFTNPELCTAFINEIRKISKNEKAWFVRVRAELLENQSNRNAFKNLGFVNSPMHLHAENTQVIEINGSDQDILYNMRKNTRYSVRKSLEQGLQTEMTTSPEATEILFDLQKKTTERHGFVGFQKKLFYEELKKFGQDDQAALFLIRDKSNKVHVAAIIIFYGDTVYYHHSASSNESRDNFASYLLQWKVIQEARKRGCKKYNLWGVSPNMNNKKHRFYGVTVFKKGFGGEQVDWLSAHDLPVSPLYWLTYGFENLRKLHRRL